uniref:RanBP-type and C3HC4-type zinc finger-containing protein 1 n=2 Tax=Aplanochytrium stocchinoi TaxID=215587 RepID=A0A7S3PFY9_9STRA|eukprot:CAMPEP_0204870144 /NCGR_PEP_ID=MMETSP1348-20121228/31652_1 /ASSEMBLY_ACC=CAM_ASM_000700 /TAXON_ID=215587 /ORGANISM="Aplanochytrium stocchinoi, Strain GSBS06" /LENGTH=590 /DNA_ID=CAMNT_0052023819 /DNA_START=56 /DNA_END=1831 /DNA_ORIENTATION=-
MANRTDTGVKEFDAPESYPNPGNGNGCTIVLKKKVDENEVCNPFDSEIVVKYFDLLGRQEYGRDVLNEIFFEETTDSSSSSSSSSIQESFLNTSSSETKSNSNATFNMNIHVHRNTVPESKTQIFSIPCSWTSSNANSEERKGCDAGVDELLSLKYDNTNAINKFEEDCSCPICFEIYCEKPPRVVVACQACNNSFCKACFISSATITKGKCPMCQERVYDTSNQLLYKRNYLLEKKVAHFSSNCVHCNVKMGRGELQTHEPECPNRMINNATQYREKETKPEIPNVQASKSHWECSACTFHNHPDLNECEMCSSVRKRRYSSGLNLLTRNINAPPDRRDRELCRSYSAHVDYHRDRWMLTEDVVPNLTEDGEIIHSQPPVAVAPFSLSPRSNSDGSVLTNISSSSARAASPICAQSELVHAQRLQYSLRSHQVLVSEGIILISVPTKKIFRKWKPCRYQLTNKSLNMFSMSHQPLQQIVIHPFMKFGNIAGLFANVVMKTTSNHKVIRTSSTKNIFSARLFEHPVWVRERYCRDFQNANYDLNPQYNVKVVIKVAMDTENDLTRFIDSFTHIVYEQKRISNEVLGSRRY